MTLRLNRFRISQRIYGGFGALIVLMVGLTIFSALQLVEIQRDVARLVSLSGNATRVLEANRLVEVLRRSSLAYQAYQGEIAAEEFKTTLPQVSALIRDALKHTLSAERAQVDREMLALLDALGTKFQDIVALGADTKANREQSEELYGSTIAMPILDIQQKLETVRNSLLHDLEDTQHATDRELATTLRLQILVSVILLLLGAVLAFAIARSIVIPLAAMTGAMKHLASGNSSTEVPAREGRDEIAEMAGAVQVFKDNGLAAEEARRRNEEVLAKVEQERSLVVNCVAAGLEQLSNGKLTVRLTESFAPEFRKLQDDFNSAMDKLQDTLKDIATGALGVHSNTQEVAATAKEQQATATEIAATTTEIGATSREISATSRELVKTMTEVTAVAGHTATLAGNSQTGLGQMEETMRNVMEAAGSINAKLTILNEKAGNINQVVTTITKVADQTNLLSLNAAIEAEKAGEYGRGFAVVASEIRRLADQTAVATYDIEQMVKEIQSAVSAGVMGMDKFSEEVRRGMHEVQQVGGQLSEIIQQVQAVMPRFEAVSEGMQAQATGAEQISQALAQLSEGTQQTVESLRQSNQAIDALNQISSGLRSGVSRFKT